MNDTDFSQYIEPTVISLFGEPKEKRGNEWRYGNHGSLAIDISKGTWYDHEECEGGGTLDIIMRETSAATVKAAINWLEVQGLKQPDQPIKPKQKSKIVKTYDYVDENGVVCYQVCRMDPKDFRQRRPNGNGGWDWKVKGTEPLPYNLPAILAKPQATVLITEGEKDADNLNALGLTATTNSGGAKKWPESLDRYFVGRRVVILPDNDTAGRNHVNLVADRLRKVADSVRVVDLPGLPPKGDVTDWIESGGTKTELIEMCKNAPEWTPDNVIEIESATDEPKESNESDQWHPFKPLGYDGRHYYYLAKGTEQISAISRSSHTSASDLISIAPIEFWELAYPKEKSGIDWQLAASDLMRQCERAGIYNHERERGRGAWYDAGRAILHMGNSLLIDGEQVSITDYKSRYFYTRQSPMDSGLSDTPASDTESDQVNEILSELNWSKSLHSALLAGWVALAPICGALSWRPHIWLTAQRGAGKSWIQDEIIYPLLGDSAMYVQGATTEAGIRQRLKQDARPIIFDEAEAEGHTDQKRMQGVILLARQSSSDTGAEIIKGTSSGDGLSFRVRSMFMMGSVNVSLSQAADESRFSVLTLEAPKKNAEEAQRFAQFERRVRSIMTSEYCASVRARIYRIIPIIRDNCEVMSQAVAEIVGSQRIGDQVGTLLAGYYALKSTQRLSIGEAREIAKLVDLEDAKEAEQISDEENLINTIMQTQVRFDNGAGAMQRSIIEIVLAASGKRALNRMTPEEANDTLGRFGLRVEGSFLMVANRHTELNKILKDSPWAAGWKRVLSRLPGSSASNAIRFAGSLSRCVQVPIDVVTG